MTKQDLINQISQQTGVAKERSYAIIETFFEVVRTALREGEPIYIRTFGSFIIKKRARKVARNIGQNTAHIVEAHPIPHFKPSREFANQVRTQRNFIEYNKPKE